jgi:hypothetical protein
LYQFLEGVAGLDGVPVCGVDGEAGGMGLVRVRLVAHTAPDIRQKRFIQDPTLSQKTHHSHLQTSYTTQQFYLVLNTSTFFTHQLFTAF